MEIVINAVYEQGRLRPLSPLVLPENSQVLVRIVHPETQADDLARAHQALMRAGVTVPRWGKNALPSPISDERRAELAQMFSSDQSLAVLISEEREER